MKLLEFFESLTIEERQSFINEAAKALGKTNSTIRSYINGNRNIQPEDARPISNLTANKVTVEELCPKVFW